MSKIKRTLLLASLSICVTAIHAQTVNSGQESQTLFSGPYFTSLFSGPYVGFKVGANISDATGAIYQPSRTTFFPGLDAGFGMDVGKALVGGEVFADFHHGSTTYKDAGLDMKLGLPIHQYMPYLRLGVTSQWPDTRLHWGLGGEYRYDRSFGLAVEWTTDESNKRRVRRRNDSFTIGLHYYFK